TRFAMGRVSLVQPCPKQLEFLIHRPKSPVPAGTERLILKPSQRDLKRLAILCHRSQLHLRRRFLLDFAGEMETFYVAARAPASRPSHPVRHALVTPDALYITVQRPRSHSGSTALLVALDSPRAEPRRYRIEFDVRSKRALLRETTNGDMPEPVEM